MLRTANTTGKKTTAEYISYQQTGLFSKLITDYLDGNATVHSFAQHPFTLEGIQNAIQQRKAYKQDRQLLVNELTKQYEKLAVAEAVSKNIQLLANENTFTVTTAHQPNILGGPLYFIYKILHAIQLANELNITFPQYHFVPVYYMGSEDADLEELNNITVGGYRYEWHTKQTGAVGRMKVDRAFETIIYNLHGQLGVLPYGEEIIQVFQRCYTPGKTIMQATLELVNELFGEYGLVILIPDNANLKKQFIPVAEKELKEKFSSKAVEETARELERHYKLQAQGRELNLFYLINDKRERIELSGELFTVNALQVSWTLDEIINELHQHPERFSANVILRGVFQEMILPDVAFVGGGGEVAYWLELKRVFEAVKVPYPVLLLRNSFMIADEDANRKINQLGLHVSDLFQNEFELMNRIVQQRTDRQLALNGTLNKMNETYSVILQQAKSVDATLAPHVESLQKKAVKKLEELEKKMMRAEKRKYGAEQSQLQKIKAALFPGNGLQERVENFSLLYAKHGKQFLDLLLKYSKGLEQQFCIIQMQ